MTTKYVLADEKIPLHIATAMLEDGVRPDYVPRDRRRDPADRRPFMKSLGLIVIVAPLVFPIAIQLDIDPIYLGIVMVVNMEIEMITLSVGLNWFVTSGVANMLVMDVVRAALPLLAARLVFLVLVTYVPWLWFFCRRSSWSRS